MAIQLFDYIEILFSRDEKKWNEMTDMDKSRNFFMTTRFMSIKYPIQAATLSPLKIDMPAASNYWHKTMSQLHGSVPTWIYAKTVKKDTAEKKLNLPSDEMIKWYCAKNELSEREFMQHVEFFKDEFIKDIKKLEKILKSQGVI